MQGPDTMTDVYTSYFYRKCGEPTGTTGSQGHAPINHSESSASGAHVSSDDKPEDGSPAHRHAIAMFVATSLHSWPTDQPHRLARDVQINDTAYRRLDPEYYAWLRSRMNLARLAADAGRLRREDFDELRVRFNAVHEWALSHFGEDALREAIGHLDARVYSPPVAEVDRRTARPKPVDDARFAEATAKVDSIRDRAIELGWTARSLYGTPGSTRGSRRRDRGLAGYLKPDDQIGEVSRESIEIILSDGIRQRLYNPDVEQPWIRRV